MANSHLANLPDVCAVLSSDVRTSWVCVYLVQFKSIIIEH